MNEMELQAYPKWKHKELRYCSQCPLANPDAQTQCGHSGGKPRDQDGCLRFNEDEFRHKIGLCDAFIDFKKMPNGELKKIRIAYKG